jgi:UPF0755 protein
MTKSVFYGIAALIVVSILGLVAFNLNQQINSFPSDSPKGKYSLAVESGQTLSELAPKLEADKVVTSSGGLLFQARVNNTQPLLAGEYELTVPAKPVNLLAELDAQTEQKIQAAASAPKLPTVAVTFREGLNLDSMFKILDEQGITKIQDLREYAQKPENFDRSKYPFLPEPLSCQYGNIKTCAKYYPEGYAYPDTYNFFKPSTPAEIFEKMFQNFNRKVWSQVRSQASGKDFQKVIITASVLEKETGRPRGITDQNRDELQTERRIIAGVFENRNELGMKWQSDPTAEYGQDRKLCQQTRKIDNCLFLDDPLVINKYNTYEVVGYPIGPISSPQLANIQAALEPQTTDYLYFVADLIGKKYFASNEAGQAQVIRQVNAVNSQL